MSSRSTVPDAWDDDWENRADKAPQSTEDIIESLPKLSKSERRAKQAELNRRLWEEAETPKNNFYVETRNQVPLQSEPKPSVKVLSRKPAPVVVAKKDPTSGVEKLSIEDDDDDDAEESKPKPLTLAERQVKAQKEREEKQRKYEEARERILGSSASASGSGSNSPGRGTQSPSRALADKGKNRGRGSNRSAAVATSKPRQLYDPNYTPKPDSLHVQKHSNTSSESPAKANEEEHVVRQPKGPDGTGRGGNGFGRARKRP